MKKRTILAILTALLLVGVFAAVSSAETIGDAGRAAEAKQKSMCGGPWNWVCTNDTDPWPACHNTGVNVTGRAQWQCLGGYDEARITDDAHRWCGDTIGVGPGGGIIYADVSCS